MESLPIYPYVVKNQQVLNITDDQLAPIKANASQFGLDTYYADNLVYPPKGPLTLPNGWNSSVYDIYDNVLNLWNGAHCSSVYDISTQCPYLEDPLGYPQAAADPSIDNFFNNQTGFLEAIRVKPNITFLECRGGMFNDTGDLPPNVSVMPGVIEKSEHVLIGGGDHDILLLTMGSELAIQNMTWSGAQGFQKGLKTNLTTSQGVRGQYTTERGLSFVEFYYAGRKSFCESYEPALMEDMIPQDDSEAAFKTTEFLIGSIDHL